MNIFPFQACYSSAPAHLYTKNFRLNLDIDSNLAYLNTLLEENSIQPWVNLYKMVMVHGTSDVTVYHQNGKDFAIRYHLKSSGEMILFPELTIAQTLGWSLRLLFTTRPED